MTAVIALDSTSSTPPYEQIRFQIATQINDGRLVAGTRLPTVRGLAVELGLAVNTVARAYRELETSHLVATKGRAGTVVTAGPDESRQRLLSAAQSYASLARDVGIGSEEALRVVQQAVVDNRDR